MKKQLLVLAASLICGSALAQGTLTLNNANPIVTVDGTAAAAAANARVQFAWALNTATVTAYTPGTSLAGWLAANPALHVETLIVPVGTPLPGRFFGGTITINTPTPGADVTGYMIGWAGNTVFSGFDAALTSGNPSARIGVSNPFAVAVGNPNAVPTPETPGDILALQPFNLVAVVPEPTSFALLGLGAAGLLIFRRRS